MFPQQTPPGFDHQVPLNTPMAFTDAWDLLKKRFAFPEVEARIIKTIKIAIDDTDRLDLARYALPFTSNLQGLENMEATFTDGEDRLNLRLTYFTGVAAHDPSAMGKVVSTITFNYFGDDRQITSAHSVLMWYEDPNYKSPFASVCDVQESNLKWVAAVNPQWALENVPQSPDYKMYSTIEGPLEAPSTVRELRITIEGIPRSGKTVVLARIARVLQRELGLVNVTVEGVDDSLMAFREKAALPDEELRSILINVPNIRLIESNVQPGVAYKNAVRVRDRINEAGVALQKELDAAVKNLKTLATDHRASPAEKFSAEQAEARRQIDGAMKTAAISTQAPSIESIMEWALNTVEAALPPLTKLAADGSFDPTDFDIIRINDGFRACSNIAEVPSVLVSISVKTLNQFPAVAKYYIEVTTVTNPTQAEASQGWSPRCVSAGYRITSLPFLSLAYSKSSEVEWGFIEKGVPDIVRNLTDVYNQVVSKHKL